MNVTLKSGKQVRFVGGGRGLEGAALDYNSGDLGSQEEPGHLHVYASEFKKWLCSGESLTMAEISEAEEQAEIESDVREAEKQAFLQRLLSEEGEALIAERQQGRNDKENAPSDICQALGLWQPDKRYSSWAEVKEARTRRIHNLESDDKEKTA